MTSFRHLSFRSGHSLKYLQSVVVGTVAFSANTCVYALGRIVNVAFGWMAFMLHLLVHILRRLTLFVTCAEAWIVLLLLEIRKSIPLQAWTGHECSGGLRRPHFKIIGTRKW
jgi:hypothetical protein